jgi:poly-gamma-glutamate synthesis protein (capsule biosynthesis protein)
MEKLPPPPSAHVQTGKTHTKAKRIIIALEALCTLVIAAVLVYCIAFNPLENRSSSGNSLVFAESAELANIYQGNEPDCPERYCISVTVNGDLLFHPALWDNFRTGNTYDFAPLFAAESQYYDKTDVAVCNFETPIAEPGGPYAGYPVFNIPPEVATAAKTAGYDVCTTATNHSFDQGTEGINRLIDTLDNLDIKHTGSYKSEADSTEPLLIDTFGGKLALISGTVSLNGMVADYDWQVDRMRDDEMRAYDVERAVAKAKLARERGADVIILGLHSVQEYLTVADTWQQSAAHELIDTGEFDFVYFHGSHSVQPLEKYKNVYIAYGLGNSLTVSAPQERFVNNQGLTLRAQFASPDRATWRLAKLSYLPTFNMTGDKYAWCPLSSDRPSGYCKSESEDAQMYNRMTDIMFSMNVSLDDEVVQEWIVGN